MLSILFPFLLIGCGEKEENYQFGNTNSAEPSQSEASQPEANDLPFFVPFSPSKSVAISSSQPVPCLTDRRVAGDELIRRVPSPGD